METTVPLSINKDILEILKKIQAREEIETLVTKENLLHATDIYENTLLHLAAIWEHIILAKYLIESGCTIDAKNNLGQTPLMLAIANNCEEIVEMLMNAGADIEVKNYLGCNALRIIGDSEWTSSKILWHSFKKLQTNYFNSKEKLIEKLYHAGWSLHKAVQLKDVAFTELLLQYGYTTYIDMTNRSRQTALHVAVKSVNVEHVNLLLKYNADVNIQDSDQQTPLSYVYDYSDKYPNERLSILKMLLDKRPHLGKIIIARYIIFACASREALKLLFDANVGLSNFVDKCRVFSALAGNKDSSAVLELLGRNFFANINWGTRQGCALTTLKIRNVQTVELFMKELFDVCSANEKDFTSMLFFTLRCLSDDPYYRSCHGQGKIFIRTFLECGANLQLKVRDIMTGLDSTIIEMIVNKNLFALGKLMLCHLALQEVQGISITKLSRHKINANDRFKTYFESSQQRLKTKIYRSTTLFDLLTVIDNKLESYVRNPELLSKIQGTIIALSEYKYFHTLLQKRITPAIAIVALKKKAAPIICKIMGTSYDRFPLIADIIVDYLEEQDMKILIKASL